MFELKKKKTVPNLIRIETNYEPEVNEQLLLWRYNRIIEEGYAFPKHDFYNYCALLIKRFEKDKLKKNWNDTDEAKSKIRFELINFKLINNEKVSKEDFEFHLAERKKKITLRKKIIKKEIARTNINGKILNTIGYSNSEFYRSLLKFTSEFNDITLLDWFIPIVLTYERLVHIFIKHVEETKFGKGQFKQRSFFEYKPEEIWILLKTIIKFEKKNIENHFLMNSVNYELDNKELMKDYRRNYKNPIIFNNDFFVLKIEKHGFIKQFYQIEKTN